MTIKGDLVQRTESSINLLSGAAILYEVQICSYEKHWEGEHCPLLNISNMHFSLHKPIDQSFQDNSHSISRCVHFAVELLLRCTESPQHLILVFRA